VPENCPDKQTDTTVALIYKIKITLPTHIRSMVTIQLSNFNKTLKIIDLKTKQPQTSIKKPLFFFKIISTIQNHL